jgi:hypothetical protein
MPSLAAASISRAASLCEQICGVLVPPPRRASVGKAASAARAPPTNILRSDEPQPVEPLLIRQSYGFDVLAHLAPKS